ncbi:uncharacterized protein LOC126677693 isoform X2 [Mercurialis annua]|uniref:uncharacterized protein LOC126677693 isoform X2 n=1 Tax=Mercurialis annua TaxID=3986 RepID=UPI00215EE754|nr:uncharacterized protein LOC126677693 isoform X2 [Mercurialis annua]
MFEGVVHRVLVGYLGRYVKNFQKDQLKLSLWNEEVLLENVELITEAFDYLQLPFAIKQGRVGRLSIKISWKKLGWDCPIIIVLEDVFICVSQRDDHEWNMEAVERREYAAKKAQLAAAELAKLSRRVCDNQAGKSFISYITAKVLDSIQMSIRNFHVQYSGMHLNSVLFGLKFSSLVIKQNVLGSSVGKMGGGQANKTVDIEGLELYCTTFEGVKESTSLDDGAHSTCWYNGRSEDVMSDYLLQPFDVAISLMVNRVGKFDNDLAQYSIRAEITGLDMSLDEVQLQQMLILSDYISISRLRERYGCYRPWGHSLSRKHNNWQITWWRYAQESVLSDVRKKLKKTSWRYLGERLERRRKYINLYKIKLDFLQQEQSIDEFIVRELEQMEKESDIDDILCYRSAGEHELQEVLSRSSSSTKGTNSSNSFDKSRNDELSSGRSKGWLNWLSRGMLGAGGTDDSTQFSGIVSDEVVKDIYEATEFHPFVSSSANANADASDKMFAFAIKLSIGQVAAALQSKYFSQKIAVLNLENAVMECKLWDEVAGFSFFINSGKVVYPYNGRVVLQIGREDELIPCKVQVDLSPKQEVELLVKVMIQHIEVTYDVEFFLKLMEFFSVLKSFEPQQRRVFLSLNGFKDVKTRLLSKAEYALSNQKQTSWDISILNISINLLGRDAILGNIHLVLNLGSLLFTSKHDMEPVISNIQEQSYILKMFSKSTSAANCLKDFQIQDLYNNFSVKLENVELKIEIPQHAQTLTILEKFCASVTFAACIISDEPNLKQLEVYVILPSVAANFNVPIYESTVALLAHLHSLHSATRSLISKNPHSLNVMENQSGASVAGYLITTKINSLSFLVDVANYGESSCQLMLFLQESDIRYSHAEFEECIVDTKLLKVTASSSKGENDGCILFSSGNQFASSAGHHQNFGFDSNQDENCSDLRRFSEGFFYLHYKGYKSVDFVCHEYTIGLNDVNFHCYPHIFGRLIAFYERLSSYGAHPTCDNPFSHFMDQKDPHRRPEFQFQKFGYSNFFAMESSDCAAISLESYPFITISNTGSLHDLESSLLYSIPDWRKSFKLRDRKIRSSKFSLKESKPGLASHGMHTSGINSFPKAGSSPDQDICSVSISLSSITVHFHDSSCIVGTITIPTSRSTCLIYAEYMDFMCSMEGLILTSPWWTKNFKDYLWGPSLSDPSSILNLRVRKGHAGSVNSQLEVSIGIQHVYCFLPPEYLAIIIGYFSLSDWSPKASVQPVGEKNDYIASRQTDSVVYKFEVLDSILIMPVEQDDHHFLKIELQQLYCSFIVDCSPDCVMKEIPQECSVPMHKVYKANDCLNIFGRDLFLSLIMCADGEYGCLLLDEEDSGCGNIMLIAPLTVDIWVRLPCEDIPHISSSAASICVMSRIVNCQLVADDCYMLDGIEALVDVINQFTSVGDESKCFTSDVLCFFQLKRSLKESGEVLPVCSGTSFTEARCYANSVSIILHQRRKDSMASQPIAKVDMQFDCSASLINQTPTYFNLNFSTVALHSLLNSVMIAQCANDCSASSALRICFSKSVEGANEFCISLPYLNIWLHAMEWSTLSDICNSYSKRMAETILLESSLKKHSLKDTADHSESAAVAVSPSYPPKKSTVTDCVNEHADQDLVVLSVRSENVGLTIHFPVRNIQTSLGETGTSEVQDHESPHATEGNCKYVAVTTHSRNIELMMAGKLVKLNFVLEKISGNVEIMKDHNVTTWPFFQISEVSVATEICNNQMDLVDIKLDVDVGPLDLWLSHQVLCFWYGVQCDIPKSETSQSSFGSVSSKMQLKKVSLLISDERWSCGGPLLQVLMRNSLLHFFITENNVESSVASDLEVNYKNINKVLWEPFVEPWKFQISMTRTEKGNALLDPSIMTEFHLSSTVPLNLNCTESVIECIFRTTEMINDARHLISSIDPCEIQKFSSPQFTDTINGGIYAPYVLQNLTSLPLVYHVLRGLVNVDEYDMSVMEEGKSVEPGASVPIYLIETPEEHLVRFKSVQSSDRLSDKQSIGVGHHFMIIQLEGMSLSSAPVSMDLVGVTCFEVDFSKASNSVEVSKASEISKYNAKTEKAVQSETNDGFTVPVIFDVSMQRYSKLLRLYSTVILSNTTSLPLELRFDIPFGVSPKILDPINPGQEVALPLHLAETGRLRWRPLGNSYLWSELHDLSNILSQEIKLEFLRSFVCYPRHPSSDPFRCCISVQKTSVPSSGKSKKSIPCYPSITKKQSIGISNADWKQSKKRFIHRVTLSTPLVLNSYLPDAISLTIESGGVTHTALLSEEKTSFHHIDPSHDLSLEFYIQGFKRSALKFPRAETFSLMAQFHGTKFFLTETMIFDPELSNGPLYITVEKMMDAFSGARDIFICVPFLVYNCTGLSLIISESAAEMEGNNYSIPSCYSIEHEYLQDKKHGLSIFSSDQDLRGIGPQFRHRGRTFMENAIVFSKKKVNPLSYTSMKQPLPSSRSSVPLYRNDSVSEKASSFVCSTSESTSRDSALIETVRGKVEPCMFSPCAISRAGEFMVRVRRGLHGNVVEKEPNSSWSEPFLLVPPSGSSTILVPQPSPHAAFIISVTSSAVGGPVAGRTRAITFQPRYVISNACSQDLCYKQKGTEVYVHLRIGQHSHLHWTDTRRELLLSVRFDEPGWQWSGSFLPDHIGDTQIKMRNHISGTISMIRVEVQNADVSTRDENIVGSLNGDAGTNLILLSDDNTGFMPYRIDNFSKERLRIFQQRCEAFDTIIHPYTSCPYAWDEPCYPHRLTVEVPGERAIGLFDLDDLREYAPVHLKSTSEKPERTLLLSIHAERTTKVFSILDSAYHILEDVRDPINSWFHLKSKSEQKPKIFVDYKEKFSVSVSCIGISLMNANPQELLFVSAKDITLNLLQSLDQQKLSFQMSSLQIDNQLQTTPFPVILSFNPEYRSSVAGQRAKKDLTNLKSELMGQISSESDCEPVVDLAIATWRKKDISFVSFEYIMLSVANFRLELEQEFLLSLLNFFRSVSSRFQSSVLPISGPLCYPLMNNTGLTHTQNYECDKTRDNNLHGINFFRFSKRNSSSSYLPSVVPIGAPWQKIYFLARRQKKIYVELFDLAPINFTLSFSSSPWLSNNGVLTLGESLIHRGLVALADVEGARIHLKQLTFSHQMASLESMQDLLIKHYTRQLLHEMYKVFGSAGVIGNPIGFARSLALGVKDFLSVPARSILQSPTGLFVGMAQGTTSLLSYTVYALSDAATQFSKAAHKGIVAFTFDDQSRMEKKQIDVASHSKGVINEVFKGLTGLLQAPIKEAEKHGLPGVLSGIAFGVTGLVARPAASILEVTGKTAESIRNRSKLYQIRSQRYRVRIPRPLSREFPLRPYSLEEAVGTSVLTEVDDGLKLKDEVFVMCKLLKQAGKFVVVTERLILIISCPSLADLGKPDFRGFRVEPEWLVESVIGLDSVIHADTAEEMVHIVGSSSDSLQRHNQHPLKKGGGTRTKQWSSDSSRLPLFQTNLELASKKDADELLEILSILEKGKGQGCGSANILHRRIVCLKENPYVFLGPNQH